MSGGAGARWRLGRARTPATRRGGWRAARVVATACALVLGAVPGVALPVAGGRVYTANAESGTITVIDGVSMQVVATIDARGHLTSDLALSPDESRLFATNAQSGTLTVVDTASNEVVGTVAVGKMPHAVAVTPDGKQVWIVNADEDAIAIVHPTSVRVIGRLSLGAVPGDGTLCFTPDGSRAYLTIPPRGRVLVIDVASRRVLSSVAVGKRPTAIRVTADGRRVWGTDAGGDEIYALDGATNRVLGMLRVGNAPNRLAIVGDRLYVTVGGTDEVAIIGDLDGEVRVLDRIAVGGRPGAVWPSPSGGRLYVARESANELVAYEIGTHQLVGRAPVGRGPVAVVAAH